LNSLSEAIEVGGAVGKRSLQIITAILAAIPVLTGLVGMLGLSDPLYASAHLPPSVVLDSNLRFLAGVWFGLGVALYWTVPRIDQQTTLFRACWGMIFVGGVGRVISMLTFATPPAPFIGFTALEIIGAPLMVLWQARLARFRI
jgi:hypothetical protein